jgi:hypothetical protein
MTFYGCKLRMFIISYSVCQMQAFPALTNICEMGAYSIEATFKCSTLGYASGLTHKHQTRQERFAKDKHSSLLRTLVNYGHKTFYNIGSCVRLVHLTGLFEMHSKATQATVKLTACFLKPLSLPSLLSLTHTQSCI